MFALIYQNQIDSVKELRYYLLKGIIKNYNVSINEKNVYDQAIESDIKQYKETRKLATVKSKGYTIGSLLGYRYTKSCTRLIAVDLSRQQTKKIRS